MFFATLLALSTATVPTPVPSEPILSYMFEMQGVPTLQVTLGCQDMEQSLGNMPGILRTQKSILELAIRQYKSGHITIDLLDEAVENYVRLRATHVEMSAFNHYACSK